MKIRLKKDARWIWIKNQYRMGPWTEYQKNWINILEKVQGTTLIIETKYLWDDQFNTVPVPNVSKHGLRVLDFKNDVSLIEEIIDDVRPYRCKCASCNHYIIYGRDPADPCWWCGEKFL